MEVSVKPKILKIVLKFLNASLVMSGLMAVVSGFIYLYIYIFKEYEFTSLVSIKCFSSILILSGTVALVLGGLGIGLITEKSRFFCVIFTLFVFILLLLCMTFGLVGVLSKKKLEEKIFSNMKEDFKNYDEETRNFVSRRVDWLQSEYNCCGVNSSSDWSEPLSPDIESWVHKNNVSGSIYDVPDSCCIKSQKTCGKRYQKERGLINIRGCFEPYTEKTMSSYLNLSIIFLIFTTYIYVLIFIFLIMIKYFKSSYILIKRI